MLLLLSGSWESVWLPLGMIFACWTAESIFVEQGCTVYVLTQCWFIMSKAQWLWCECIIRARHKDSNQKNNIQKCISKITSTYLGINELKTNHMDHDQSLFVIQVVPNFGVFMYSESRLRDWCEFSYYIDHFLFIRKIFDENNFIEWFWYFTKSGCLRSQK